MSRIQESQNNFNSTENKMLVWDMLVNNRIFDNIENDHFANVKMMFENIISGLNKNISRSEIITNERLLELNKKVIMQIKSNISVFQPKSVESLQDTERVLVFDRNLESAKNDFDTLNKPAVPKTPDFLLPDEEPLRSENMDAMLEKLKMEREKLVPTDVSGVITPPPIPEPITNPPPIPEPVPLKKLNRMEDLFDSQDESKPRKVSFNKVEEILSQEYSGEKRVNNNIKLTKVFDLLTEINLKHDEILTLLHSPSIL